MNTIEQQIIDTWFINHRTNIKLMENLTEDALSLTTSKRGGGTVGHQLAHMYNVRYWKLEKYHKPSVAELKTIKATDEKTLGMLRKYHSVSADLVAEYLTHGIEHDYKMKGPYFYRPTQNLVLQNFVVIRSTAICHQVKIHNGKSAMCCIFCIISYFVQLSQ